MSKLIDSEMSSVRLGSTFSISLANGTTACWYINLAFDGVNCGDTNGGDTNGGDINGDVDESTLVSVLFARGATDG